MPTADPALTQYVPGLALQRLAADPAPIQVPSTEPGEAAVLFIDISGFTPLTERLGRRGAAGAEEMGRLLADYFGIFVDTTSAHGGQIVDFAGDALFAIWRDDPLPDCCRRAAACALALQALVGAIPPGALHLSIKASIGAGEVTVMHVGGDGFRNCLVAGPAFSQATRAEHLSEPDDVVLSPQAAAHIAGDLRPLADGHSRLLSLSDPLPLRPIVAPALPVDAEAALREYLPEAVLSRIAAGQVAWLSEFRRVTTVFVNVIGLNYDSPSVGGRINDVAVAIREVVRRFEGGVQQFLVDDKGTVLLIAFGLPPRAHEDDPARGVQAAMEIEEALSGLGLRSAIGITTAKIFCGPIGGQVRQQYTVVGDRVNLAARLMQLALDDVLCDAATAHHLSEDDYEALPAAKVKGKAAPVAVFRPYGVGHKALGSSRTPLLGRTAELAGLRDRLTALEASGEGAVVLIEGEAGIGKSRLVEALAVEADLLGVETLLGAARAIEQASPWFAWRAVLHEVLGLTHVPANPGARRRHLLRRLRSEPDWFELAPLLNPLLGADLRESEATASMAGRRRSSRTLDLAIHLLTAAASAAPTLLIVEDAHWLDSVSWGLLQRVVRDVPGLLVVVASRPMVGATAVEYDRLRAATTEHLVLDAMAPTDTLALVCAKLGISALPRQVAHLITSRAEGHPFFSVELAWSLRDTGILEIDGDRARLAPSADLDALDLPDTVQGVIISRIDGLTPRQQLLLKVASVVGRVFRFEAVSAAYPTAADDDELLAMLQTLSQLDLTRVETPPPDLSHLFKHIITRDVTYDAMSYAQRRQLHGSIAAWYERRFADDLEPWVPVLAHHWAQAAGDRADDAHALRKAAQYLEQSGEIAMKSGAFKEAADFLRRAFDAHRSLPEADADVEDELRLLGLLGTAVFTTTGYGSRDSLEVYERSLALAEGQVDDRRLFPILWGLWINRHFTNAMADALDLGERMMQIATDLGDPELRLQAHHAMWTSLIQIPDYTRARRHLEAGIPLYEPSMHESHCVQFGGHDPGACGLRAMGLTGWTMGQVDQAVKWTRDGIGMGRRHDYTVATAQLAAAFVHKQRGDHDAAERVATELIQRAERNALGGFTPWAQMFLAWAVGRRGDVAAGIAQLEEIRPRLGMDDAGYLSMLLDLYVEAGDFASGRALLQDLFARSALKDEHVYQAELLRYRGEFHWLAGDVDSAAADFRSAQELAHEQGALSFELRAATRFAQLRRETDPEACLALLTGVYSRFEEGFETEDLRRARVLLDDLGGKNVTPASGPAP